MALADARSLEQLKQALRRLPGVGPKTAQRMAFHLLERDREGARMIAQSLDRAIKSINHCTRCNNFCESELCGICASTKRDANMLCVVETPADLDSLEQAGVYQGLYFVLMGHLSPLDGVGVEDIGIDKLLDVLASHDISEIILATNLTVEGEATADFIGNLLVDKNVSITRLARGVPMGGELEYMDPGTLNQALSDRRSI